MNCSHNAIKDLELRKGSNDQKRVDILQTALSIERITK
jgi:hypothetical protein